MKTVKQTTRHTSFKRFSNALLLVTVGLLLIVACGGKDPEPTAIIYPSPVATATIPVDATLSAPSPTVSTTAPTEVYSSVPMPTVVATLPSSVSLRAQSASLGIGSTRQIGATFQDVDGNVLSDVTATWTSSNSSAATISTTGIATGIATGSTTITVRTGEITASVTLTVADAALVSVTVAPQTATVQVGRSRELAATFQDAAGNVVIGPNVTWTSSDPSSATVSSSGLVTGVSNGPVTITATSEGKVGTSLITVADLTTASVGVSPQAASLAIGQGLELAVSLTDVAGNVVMGPTVTWTSSNPSSVSVGATGMVTGIAPGSSTITATSEGKAGTSLISVTGGTTASVSVSPQSVTLTTGQTQDLVASLRGSDGGVMTGLTVAWSSSNQSSASVTAAGVVTGIAPGSSTITASSEGKTGTAVITVSGAPVASLTVNPQSFKLVTGQTQQPIATLKDARGNILTDPTVTWSSSNQPSAGVSNTGLVIGIAPGTSTITATSEGQTGTVVVTVSGLPVASVAINPSLMVLLVGETRQAVATPTDANEAEVTGVTVTWSTSDPSIAIVSVTGLVTGKAPGSATITATSEGVSGNATIEMVDPP